MLSSQTIFLLFLNDKVAMCPEMAACCPTGGGAMGFSLPCTEGPGTPPRQVSLDSYADRWLILLFYSRDFSLV